jgi:beta-phosphoglucomutase-like phosphatase (HAD superfamily)
MNRLRTGPLSPEREDARLPAPLIAERPGPDGWPDDEADLQTKARSPATPVTPADTLVASWLSAFAAADRALGSNAEQLGPFDASKRGNRLRTEREQVAGLLEAVAHGHRGASLLLRYLRGGSIDIRVLHLPSGVSACVFDVEGVLTTSAAAHREAWCATLDTYLLARAERLRRPFVAVDRNLDYSNHLDGRPRLAGLRAFLASRGISLPEGEPSDLPGAESVHGLANRKEELLRRFIAQKGVEAFAGSRAYLEVARIVGARRAVVSASAHTSLVLRYAGIADLVEQQIDGRTLETEALRPKPAPDMLLAACARLGVDPTEAAAFETNPAGITAARAGGLRAAVAVARDENAAAFSASDPDLIVNDLGEMLEHAGLGASV